VKRAFEKATLTPEFVAEKTLQAMNRNKGLIVLGRDGKIGDVIQRISRELFVTMMLKRSK